MAPEAVLQALAWRATCSDDGAKLARWTLSLPAGVEAFLDVQPPGPTPASAHLRLAHRQQQALRALGLHAVLAPQLPACLRKLARVPLLLFVRGNVAVLHETQAVAIVGARRAHAGPLAWARDHAAAHARAGNLVVSGGALGIDAAAHAGALDAGGKTLAYMGTPIDRIYPATNAPLFRRMLAQGGALVSEHPPLATTYKSAHAQRNRLIAAHGRQLVVVEAGLRSGTMSAVRHARAAATPVCCAPAQLGGETSGLQHVVAQGWGHFLPPGPLHTQQAERLAPQAP